MNIPFADLFEKLRARFLSAPTTNKAPGVTASAAPKPEGQRFAKTVLPNAVRTFTPEPASPAPVPTGGAIGPRMVSLGRTGSSQSRDLPPAVALALEPRVERVLSLSLGDVIEQMPEGYLKPRASFDTTRRVLLKAAEVEKGMAARQPTLGVSALYQQMPEIFMHVVTASDATVVPLPFEKLSGELSQLSRRQDQTNEEVGRQFETPFLQVTMEDTERFGIPMAPVQIAEMPPVQMDSAAPRSAAAAHSEPAGREKSASPVSMPAIPSITSAPIPALKEEDAAGGAAPAATMQGETAPVAPRNTDERETAPVTRIPFHFPSSANEPVPAAPENLSRLGTGEPVFPRVPASSGPPVPPPPPAPARIPFKLSHAAPAGSSASTQSATRGLNLEPRPAPAAQEETAPPDAPVVTLPLRAILETLPPMQLRGSASSVPAEANISFRLTTIAPQLQKGKVAIAPREFHAAMPAAHRDLFLPDAIDTPVALPLADVLSNLPGDALRVRDDQEVHTPDEVFETPFSKKAEEDARRFAKQQPEAPEPEQTEPNKAREVARPVEADVVTPPSAEPISGAVPFTQTAGPSTGPGLLKGDEDNRQSAVSSLPAVQPKLAQDFDAKTAVADASALSGVASCGVTFADGLSIAGNVPAELRVDGLRAVAPTLLQKLEKHMLQTQLGALTCLTVHGEKSPVSFFAAGNICLTAVHGERDLSAETRGALARIAQQLSQTYSQPETTHVDH